jgi:hypothetical protein
MQRSTVPLTTTARPPQALTALFLGSLPEQPTELIHSALVEIPLPNWDSSLSHNQNKVTRRLTAVIKDSEQSVRVELCQITTLSAGARVQENSGKIILKTRVPKKELAIDLSLFPDTTATLFEKILPRLGESQKLERRYSQACDQAELFSLDREWALQFVGELLDQGIDGSEEPTPYDSWQDYCHVVGRDSDDISFKVDQYGKSRRYTIDGTELHLSAATMLQLDQHENGVSFTGLIAEFSNPSAKRYHKASVSMDFPDESLRPLINLAIRDRLLPSNRSD